MKVLLQALFICSLSMQICNMSCANTLVELSDAELAQIQGQALLSLSQSAGTSPVDNSQINFFKLGAEAVIDLNANINSLQLGCGGSNGVGNCDLDIDNLSLSGIPLNSDGSINYDYTSADRVDTSASITNPFIEFAIKNPTSQSTRELIGFRLSAEAIQGLLTLGTENSSTPNGINSFSGYIQTKQATGTAYTQETLMNYAGVDSANGVLNDGDAIISGRVRGTILGLGVNVDYESSDYDFTLQSTAAPFTINSTVITGSRITANTVVLKGSGTVDDIIFSGPLAADTDFGTLNKEVSGSISGLQTDITVTQQLGLIHSLFLQNPVSISLQKEKILWPNASVAAEKGWWMAIEDELELGDVSPIAQVEISNQVLLQTILPISSYLTNNPSNCGGLISGCLLGGSLDVGEISLNTTILDFPLVNLVLQGQNFRPNCYGNLKFC